MFTIFLNLKSRLQLWSFPLSRVFFSLLIALNFFWLMRPAVLGDLVFFVDVSRDFHLYREIDQKKLILIGPRSSIAGLFHGPLWLYVTYPGYLMGNGDPSFMPTYWLFLIVIFLISSFWIANRLFGLWSSLVFVGLLSGSLIFYSNQLINPYGAFFLMPLFFYLLVLFQRTKRLRYLASHLLVACLILQFQIAIGVPLLLLSMLYALWVVIRERRPALLLAYFVPLVGLVNFILFELRHSFQLLKSAVAFANPAQTEKVVDYVSLLVNRWQYLVNLQLIDRAELFYVYGFLIVFVFLLVYRFKVKSDRDVYSLFLYYYLGYFLLSFVNKDVILYHQIVPLIPLTQLMFASFARDRTLMLTGVTFLLIWWLNFQRASVFVREFESQFVGKDQESWVALNVMIKEYFANQKEEFGYFVYSPDSVAYHGRYAALWIFEKLHLRGYEYEKRPLTFVILAPPPKFDRDLKPDWWIENKLRMKTKPVATTTFASGYQIYRYELTADELSVPFDESIRIGTFFR